MQSLMIPYPEPSHAVCETIRRKIGLKPYKPRGSVTGQRIQRMQQAAYALEACDNGLVDFVGYKTLWEQNPEIEWDWCDFSWGGRKTETENPWKCNGHYDLPFQFLQLYLLTRDRRAWELFDMHARCRARYGTDKEHNPRWDTFGLAKFEKGFPQGTGWESRETHTWVAGVGWHAALTNDPETREAFQLAVNHLMQENYRQWPLANAIAYYELRQLTRPAEALLRAFELTGIVDYFNRAEEFILQFVKLEEDGGKLGMYFNPTNPADPVGCIFQQWGTYATNALLLYRKHKRSARIVEHLGRMANACYALMSQFPEHQVIRLPRDYRLGKSLWQQGELNLLFAMMCLPLIDVACKDFSYWSARKFKKLRSRLLFETACFLHEKEDLPYDANRRCPIGINSPQYPGSAPKTFAQFFDSTIRTVESEK